MYKTLIFLAFVCPSFAFAETLIVGVPYQNCPDTVGIQNYFMAEPFVASSTGDVEMIRAYSAQNGTTNYGIYSDVAGAPTVRLGYKNNVAVVTGLNDITFPTTTLTNGVTYWLAYDTNGVLGCQQSSGGSNSAGYYALNQSSGMPVTPSALTFAGGYKNINLAGIQLSTTASSTDVASTSPDTTTKGDLGLIGLILLTFAWYYFIVHLHGKFFPVK